MQKKYSYDELLEKIDSLEKELSALRKKDQLTGVYNRTVFYEKAHEAFSRTSRYSKDLSILVLDITDMDSLNRKYGFDAGDFILKTAAAKIDSLTRSTDVTGRISGDNFAVLMEDTGNSSAKKAAERIKGYINALPLKYEEQNINFSIVLGLSSYESNDNSIYELIKRAEESAC